MMKVDWTRRKILLCLFFYLPLAGCTYINNEGRVLQTYVANHTHNGIDIQLSIEYSGDVIFEQHSYIPSRDLKGYNMHTESQMEFAELSKGSELTARIIVNEDREETMHTTLDCDTGNQWSGDEISFRIHESYIDAKSGCAGRGESP